MPLKVSQLAKEFKISSAALKAYLDGMGISVKSHFSALSDEQVENVRKKYSDDVNAVRTIRKDSKKIHRKIDHTRKTNFRNRPKFKPSSKNAVNTWTSSGVIKKREGSAISSPPPRQRGSFSQKPTQPKFFDFAQPEIFGKDLPSTKGKKKTDQKGKHQDRQQKVLLKNYKDKKANRDFLDDSNIKYTIKKVTSKSEKKKKYKKEEKPTHTGPKTIEVNEFTSVSELAKLMDVPATEIIAKFFKMGQMITINQRLDKDSIQIICNEYDMDIVSKDEFGTDLIADHQQTTGTDKTISRPPIVTIMGHVDHGKTSILDYIRKENVVAGESGGITQHIGAYQITYQNNKITFLDTPGHEAFAAMRSRGANVTDIAVIVVAANDGVKPTTIEAIDHAKAAGVQIVVAINKVDLPTANIDEAISGLARQSVLLEGYGGDTVWVECSAKTGQGIDSLLDSILLISEVSELRAKVDTPANGVVIESSMNQQLGSIATVLVKEGVLKKGDQIVCGATYGKIRRMENERAKEIKKLYPADVALVFGLKDVSTAGDMFYQMKDEKLALKIAKERQLIRRQRVVHKTHVSFDNLFSKIKQENLKKLNLIVKADTDGSVEALCDSFEKLSNDEITVKIIHKAVGGINEADVFLASSSDAIIIGFHVRTNNKAKTLAEKEEVQIKIYQIIYNAIEDLKTSLTGMLSPIITESVLGTSRVKEVFKMKKVGTIAGCAVEKGAMKKPAKVRLYRENIVIFDGDLQTLKHFKEEVDQVKAGQECGIKIKNFNDIKAGDVIEVYIRQEKKPQL